MLELLRKIFTVVTIIIVAFGIATGYTAVVSAIGLCPSVIPAGLLGITIFIGAFWTISFGLYVPWMLVKGWDVWHQLEGMAESAELPANIRQTIDRLA